MITITETYIKKIPNFTWKKNKKREKKNQETRECLFVFRKGRRDIHFTSFSLVAY